MDGHFCGNFKSPQKLPVVPREKMLASVVEKKLIFYGYLQTTDECSRMCQQLTLRE